MKLTSYVVQQMNYPAYFSHFVAVHATIR